MGLETDFPLHHAAAKDDAKKVKYILYGGHNINERDRVSLRHLFTVLYTEFLFSMTKQNGRTPLIYSAAKAKNTSKTETMEVLLDNGAEINISCKVSYLL